MADNQTPEPIPENEDFAIASMRLFLATGMAFWPKIGPKSQYFTNSACEKP